VSVTLLNLEMERDAVALSVNACSDTHIHSNRDRRRDKRHITQCIGLYKPIGSAYIPSPPLHRAVCICTYVCMYIHVYVHTVHELLPRRPQHQPAGSRAVVNGAQTREQQGLVLVPYRSVLIDHPDPSRRSSRFGPEWGTARLFVLLSMLGEVLKRGGYV